MNYTYKCFCDCSDILKDYNIFEFMYVHPIQVIALVVFLCLLLFIILTALSKL
jgi:hypothetical protein